MSIDEREAGDAPRRVGGAYPGGPSASRPVDTGHRELRSRTDLEARIAERTGRLRRRRRSRRVRAAWVGAVITAGALGYYLGVRAHAPVEQALEARSGASADVNALVSGEVNRMLIELWKMEDAERAPRP